MIAYLVFVFTKIVFKVIGALPLPFLLKLARCIGFLGCYLDSAHKRLALQNLEIAFGEKSSAKTVRKSFMHLIENIFTFAWMAKRDPTEIQKFFEVIGVEAHLLPAVAKGKGVILAMFHLGNWEILSQIAPYISNVKFSTIYQPLKNPYLNQMVAEWRSCRGVRPINRHHGFTEIIKYLRQGQVIGVFVDQHAGDHGMWLPFFRRLASTTPLPALLARRTGATVIPVFCTNVPKDTNDPFPRWRMEFASPVLTSSRSDGEIMMEIHQRLEEVIRHDPTNWFWLHDRWKTPSPNFLLKGYRRGVYVPPKAQLQPFRVLLRSPNWLGDAVLAIPAVHAIRTARPDIHLTILTPAKLTDFWKEQKEADDVITSIREVHGRRWDAAILLPNSLRSALEACYLRIPRRQGYAGHYRRRLLTAVCPENFRAGFHEHEVKDFCGLARWCGAEIKNEIPSLKVKVDKKSPRPYIVLHPGAAHGSAKRWLAERFVELVKHFPNEHWYLIGNSNEIERNAQLTTQIDNGIEDWTGRLTLNQLAAMLAQAQAVVCNDSGPMHLAAAVGTRVVAIFGSTEPKHTGPLGQGHYVIRHQVLCSPCYRKECPIDLRCMKAVSVDEVAKALQEILSNQR